ncbi:hypothetical protein C8R48DRAFT_671101 [Suillus tomentosus]|nr:hypothetical protein C8R48DRAFT_671101 [Suillus tomentosus]
MENSATLNLLDAPQCCGINLNLDASVLTATAVMSNMELVSQFTEDAIAKEDRICGRPACGSIILKGAPYHYIATIVPSQPGRFVCRAFCPSSAQSLPDPNVIWQSVNAAQRRSTINPPRVVPFLPQPSSSAVHMGRLPGPDIAVPLSWQQPPVSFSQNRAPGPAGYSAHHAQYSLEPYAVMHERDKEDMRDCLALCH